MMWPQERDERYWFFFLLLLQIASYFVYVEVNRILKNIPIHSLFLFPLPPFPQTKAMANSGLQIEDPSIYGFYILFCRHNL